MSAATNYRELILGELHIARTLVDICRSKLATEDTNGASRAVRNAETALEGLPDLLRNLEIRDEDRQLRTEIQDVRKLLDDLSGEDPREALPRMKSPSA